MLLYSDGVFDIGLIYVSSYINNWRILMTLCSHEAADINKLFVHFKVC